MIKTPEFIQKICDCKEKFAKYLVLLERINSKKENTK